MDKSKHDEKLKAVKHTGIVTTAGSRAEGPNWRSVVMMQTWEKGEITAEEFLEGKTAWGNRDGARLEAQGMLKIVHDKMKETAQELNVELGEPELTVDERHIKK